MARRCATILGRFVLVGDLMIRAAIACVLLLLLANPVAAAEQQEPIYRCRGADGAISFSDYPCPAGSRSEALRQPGEPVSKGVVAGVLPLCGKAADNAGQGFSTEFRSALPPLQAAALDLALQTLADASAGGYRWMRSGRGDIHLCGQSRRGDPLELVAAEGGEVVRFRGQIGQYLNDPETPEALRTRCRQLVSQCAARSEAGIDGCVHGSPVCESDPPWAGGSACCPKACKESHARLRGEGVPALEAFQRALEGPPGCIPGT